MENRHSSPPNSGGEGAWQGDHNQALGLLSVGGKQKRRARHNHARLDTTLLNL